MSPLPVEALTEKSNIKVVKDAIWKTTEQMMGEYELDGKIDETVFQNWDSAWDYSRKQSYKLAREATGRKLPEH